MINNILNDYEEMRQQDDKNFLKIMKRMEIEDKIYVLTLIVCVLVVFIMLLLDWPNIAICAIIIMMVATSIWSILNRRRQRKKWDINIHKYQDRLDMIREILIKPEFNMYDKNKLKQLIRKYKEDIDRIEKENSDIKRNYSNFLSKYIAPVITFAIGKWSQEITGADVFVICVFVLIVVVLTKIIIDSISMIQTEIIEGNERNRKYLFVQELQDLVDRDFPIENEDLL